MVEDIKSVDQKSENSNSENSESPKRGESFITGHRIPLELFSSETLRRIELLPEQTTVQVCNSSLHWLVSAVKKFFFIQWSILVCFLSHFLIIFYPFWKGCHAIYLAYELLKWHAVVVSCSPTGPRLGGVKIMVHEWEGCLLPGFWGFGLVRLDLSLGGVLVWWWCHHMVGICSTIRKRAKRTLVTTVKTNVVQIKLPEKVSHKLILAIFFDLYFQESNRYVNSQSFRSSSSSSTSSSSSSSSEHRPYLPLQDDRETLLGAEIDPNYRR